MFDLLQWLPSLYTRLRISLAYYTSNSTHVTCADSITDYQVFGRKSFNRVAQFDRA